MDDQKNNQEWTLPVVDSNIPVSTEQAGIGATGAWASYAIGVVTKNFNKQHSDKNFPLIEAGEHPAHLTLMSTDDSQSD